MISYIILFLPPLFFFWIIADLWRQYRREKRFEERLKTGLNDPVDNSIDGAPDMGEDAVKGGDG